MLKLAVIGKDVSQSVSPQIHQYIFKRLGKACTYDAVSIAPQDFSARAEKLFETYDAFNVTIPFKQEIIPYLRELREDAQSFQAVNTVLSRERAGYNTDGKGFLLMLQNAGIDVRGKEALVLGAGGAGRSCVKKLTEAGAKVFVFERFSERLDEVYREFGNFTPLKRVPLRPFDIVFNCTGIGMHDTVGTTPQIVTESGEQAPIGRELLSLCESAVDLIYVPAQSEFLKIAAAEGKKTLNGASMLFYQAYYADCIYLGTTPDPEAAKELWNGFSKEDV